MIIRKDDYGYMSLFLKAESYEEHKLIEKWYKQIRDKLNLLNLK